MGKLKDSGAITPTPFDEEIEWIFFELWHHEGRRARMGAAMMGPDYAHWHGFYDLSKNFYNEFIPEAEHLKPGVTTEVMNMEEHAWKKGMTKEEIAEMLAFYEGRYGGETAK